MALLRPPYQEDLSHASLGGEQGAEPAEMRQEPKGGIGSVASGPPRDLLRAWKTLPVDGR